MLRSLKSHSPAIETQFRKWVNAEYHIIHIADIMFYVIVYWQFIVLI